MLKKRFIGRGEEITLIMDWLQNPKGRIVLITGAGGIGKTTLLQKIAQDCSTKERCIVEYFDLAEQPGAVINQAVHLVNTIGSKKFPEFDQRLMELEISQGEFQSVDLQEEAVNEFVRELNEFLTNQDKKLLRITDTFEIALKYKLYEDDLVKGINGKLKNNSDTFFIVAGRDMLGDRNIIEEIFPMFQDVFGKESVLHIPISGFDNFEIEEFFAVFDEHRKIPQDIRKKLHLLTDGRPILLLLAVDWLQKNIPLPIMIDKSLSELQELIDDEDSRKELLDIFEFELVSKVRNLRSPLDVVVLYMAQFDRRFDSKLLSLLLDEDIGIAEKELQNLLSLPFVKEFIGSEKPKCTLHDEMRDLVNKHAWHSLDISGEERKRITRKVIEHYYYPSIELLKQRNQELLQRESQATLLDNLQARSNNWERWYLEAETVYYHTKVSEEDGFSYFDKVFYDKEESYIRDQLLLDELKRARVDENKIALREADEMRRRGQIDEAKNICLAILDNENLSEGDRIHGHSTLGSMEIERNPVFAEQQFLIALELSESINDVRVQTIIHNNLGRLFRNISQLELAISHFERSLELSYSLDDPGTGITARNNLAWTHRLNGNLDEADTLCLLSIAENRKRGQERPLAYAYLTKADIDRDRGDFNNSEHYAKLAFELFSRLEDDEGKAQAHRTLANILRYRQDFENALRNLHNGIELIQNRNSDSLMASLYQLYGRTCRHYATFLMGESAGSQELDSTHFFQDALSSLQKSIDLAQKMGNRWEVARSKIEIALIIMLSEDPFDENRVIDLLQQVYQTADDLDDHLLKGYVHENRANIMLHNEKYLGAGSEIGEAAWHIAKRTGQEATRAFTRMHNTILDPNLTNEQCDYLAKGVYDNLQEKSYRDYPTLIALANMCQQILYI